MASEELKPCPFCGGDVSFHKDEECDGCHFIQCGQCRAFFDFATGADPENESESVEELRARIAPAWNRRAQDFDAMRQRVELLERLLSTARDYVYSELEERKAAMAGYPHKWQQEEADLAEIDAALDKQP